MKKIVLASAVTLLASCTTDYFQTSTVIEATPKSFIGNWECRMDGGVATSNKVSLAKDGSATYLGKMFMPKENPIFQYDIQRTGVWSYANQTLTYKFGKGSVSRAHSEEIRQALTVDADLSESENDYYTLLNRQMTKGGQTTINLAVSNFTKNAFDIRQNIGDTPRTGQCKRSFF